ncbi:MAG TPA: alpha/beta hydrolase [Candidatus Limnocylindria bacterium]|nr:alpha/beta hydrolase [Candidatus Limnocylindria bacterium]
MTEAAQREGVLTTRDGLRLRTLRWGGPSATPRAIVFVHGYLEHAGRYHGIAEHFVARGYTCYSMDHRGHGRSEGTRGYVSDFSLYRADLDLLVSDVRQDGADDVFLVGHSAGGLIGLGYATGRTDLAGIAVSSPYLRNALAVSGARSIALRVLSRVAPRTQLRSPLDPRDISHDPAVISDHATDPLVLRHMTPGWALAMLRDQAATLGGARRLVIPLLVMAAGADKLADPSAARDFYERAGTPDKTLLWYADHYHESFNEVDRRRVYADLLVGYGAATAGFVGPRMHETKVFRDVSAYSGDDQVSALVDGITYGAARRRCLDRCIRELARGGLASMCSAAKSGPSHVRWRAHCRADGCGQLSDALGGLPQVVGLAATSAYSHVTPTMQRDAATMDRLLSGGA